MKPSLPHAIVSGLTHLVGSPDDKTMYSTDSPTRSVFAYNYDAESSAISNKRVFFQLHDDEESVLDGCMIDLEGHLCCPRRKSRYPNLVTGGGRIASHSRRGESLVLRLVDPTSTSCSSPLQELMLVRRPQMEAEDIGACLGSKLKQRA